MRIGLIFLLGLFANDAFSQNIELGLDSVKALLCKKWEVSYVLMGNMKIERLPGAAETNFEFLKNGTVMMTGNAEADTDKTKGTWTYDPTNKHIKIITNNKNTGEIIELNEQMFVMKMNVDKDGAPSGELKTVCKPKLSESIQTKQKQTITSPVQIKNTSLKNPDSAILYVGVQNMLEIEGPQKNVSISVIGATIKRIADAKFLVIPSKKGIVILNVLQNSKIIASKQYTAILPKK